MAKPTIASSRSAASHLALVCKDMAQTVEFYRDILACR